MAVAVSYNPSLRSTGKRTAWVGKVLKKTHQKRRRKAATTEIGSDKKQNEAHL